MTNFFKRKYQFFAKCGAILKQIYLKKIRIKFNFLKKKKFAIFDNENSKYLKEFFNSDELEIIFCRKEEFNFWILIGCILSLKFDYKNYLFSYIKKINPTLIVTLIDNSTLFYELKKKIKCKTLAIQNGLRTEFEDFFSQNFIKPKNLSCDKIYVWNSDVGKKYSKYIDCKYEVIGSFKNNILCDVRSNKSQILYISTYRDKPLNQKIYKNLTWGDFIKNEKNLILFIKEYCLKNNQKLSILGRYNEKRGEKSYFSNILGTEYKFNYFGNESERPTYSIAENSDLIITIDSTLGYEMLAIGKKVALFGIRPEYYPLNTRNYVWPNIKKGNGIYWFNTQNLSYSEFSVFLSKLVFFPKNEWKKEVENIRKNIIAYDPGNKAFLKEINLCQV